MAISTDLVKAFIYYTTQQGIDTADILKRPGVDFTSETTGQTWLPVETFSQIWNEIAPWCRDPLLGLHFGKALGSITEGHYLFTLIRNCKTLQKALQELIRYHSLLTDLVVLTRHDSFNRVTLQLEYPYQLLPDTKNQLTDTVLSFLLTMLKSITAGLVTVDTILLNHSADGNPKEYERVFGIPPVFDSKTACIIFSGKELKRTLPLANSDFALSVKGFAEKLQHKMINSESLGDKLDYFFEFSMTDGQDFSLESAARACRMSARLLQKKLKAAGSSYQSLLDRSRMKLALRYLRDGETTLCDIAFLLGFAEQSSFNHAFKKWTGLTPGEYKNE